MTNNELKNVSWAPIYETTNVYSALEYFNTTLKRIFDKHAPPTKKRVKGRQCSWLSKEIKTVMIERKSQPIAHIVNMTLHSKSNNLHVCARSGLYL